MQQYILKDFYSSEMRKQLIQKIHEDSSIDISINYESDFSNAKILRELTDDFCKALGVSPKWRTRVVLIIDELNNNAIEYGSKKWDTNILYMSAQKTDDNGLNLCVEVSDSGKWEYSKIAQEMEELREKHANKDFKIHHSIRGRGLFLIIHQLVDELCFIDNAQWGLTVQVQKFLQETS